MSWAEISYQLDPTFLNKSTGQLITKQFLIKEDFIFTKSKFGGKRKNKNLIMKIRKKKY